VQGSDDAFDLCLISSRCSGGAHVDLSRSRGSHDLGDVMSAQATRHQDDDVVSPTLYEAGEGIRLSDSRIPARREHTVIPEFHKHVESPVLIRDLIDGRPGPRREAEKEVLYSLLPRHLVLHQVDDPALRRRVLRLAARAVDPLLDPAERSLRRRLLVSAQKLNHDRKFHRYHPRPLRLRLR